MLCLMVALAGRALGGVSGDLRREAPGREQGETGEAGESGCRASGRGTAGGTSCSGAAAARAGAARAAADLVE